MPHRRLTHNQYLAYKFILEPEQLTEEERVEIFDEKGAIHNQEVGYFLLKWKEEAGRLSEKDKTNLDRLSVNKMLERVGLLDAELKNMGLSLQKLHERYPEKAQLIFDKAIAFHEHRYNVVGKHLMYLSYPSFLHIYLRHVDELKVDNQFAERSKFQLAEKDVLTTMNIVLQALNDEYQEYKELHPDNRFFRKGSQAYYYNGDYYDIDIQPDGQVGTFFKRVEKD